MAGNRSRVNLFLALFRKILKVMTILLLAFNFHFTKSTKWNILSESEVQKKRERVREAQDNLFGGRENAHIPQSVHYNFGRLKQKAASGPRKAAIYQIMSARGIEDHLRWTKMISRRHEFISLIWQIYSWELPKININGKESSLPIFEVKTKHHEDKK